MLGGGAEDLNAFLTRRQAERKKDANLKWGLEIDHLVTKDYATTGHCNTVPLG